MEDIKSRLDSIIINGLLVTSNDTEIDVSQVYGKNKLMKLVGVPLENYIFEGCDLDFKQWFQSKECNLEACTKVLTPYSFIYTCLDCRVNEIGHACEDCFRRSVHFYHEHELRCYDSIYKTCDCGHLDAWKSHPTCPKHIKAERPEVVLPEPFISKLTYIIQYLCQLFEEICTENDSIFDNHMENMLETYLRAKGSNLIPNQEQSSLNAEIDANSRKSCLLIPYDDTFDLDEFIDCLKIIREISGEGGYVNTNDMKEQGYAWVLYLSDVEKCKNAKELIEQSNRILFYGQPVKCQIVKVYRLYFMRLTSILIGIMNIYCFGKIKFSEILTETIFKKTSLASAYVLNEHVLLKTMRNEMLRRILAIIQFSDTGRKYATDLLLNNIHHIYNSFAQVRRRDNSYFLDLTLSVASCPSVIVHLIEHGFLCLMIDIFSSLLRGHGIKTGADLLMLYEKDNSQGVDVRSTIDTLHLLKACFGMMVQYGTLFAKFKSQFSDAGRRLVQFCFEFDDMQPINKDPKKCNKETYGHLSILLQNIFMVISGIVKLSFNYDGIPIEMLELFLERFVNDIDRMSEDNPCVPVVQQIVNYCNIDQDTFSILNLSRRVFIEIFMDCCVKGILTKSISDKVFGDEKTLMWIAKPAITTISYVSNVFNLPWHEIPKCSGHFLDLYFEPTLINYLQMSDLHIVQILMSYLDPELLLKFLLFNICPSLRERVDFAQSMSSILTSQELYGGCSLRYLFVWIYNALLERHFLVDFQNPEYQVVERQIIHYIALRSQTFTDIRETILQYQKFRTLEDVALNERIDNALENVSYVKTIQNQKKYSLKPEFANFINIYFFLYKLYDCKNTEKLILHLYQTNKCKYQIPEIPELRDNLKGMNNFLFSNAYSELLMTVLVAWHANSTKNLVNVLDNLLITSMSLCLMLKLSTTHNISHGFQQTTDLIFGIREDLGGLNLMVFLVHLKRKVNHALLNSIVDYLIELSQIQPDIFSDISENTSDMKMKANECQALAIKIFHRKLQEDSLADSDGNKWQNEFY